MGGTLMISGNMRVLANVVSTGASAINFNSGNMIGCTVFCIQYSLYAAGSLSVSVFLNGDTSNYRCGDMRFDKNTCDSVTSSSNTQFYCRALKLNTSAIGGSMSASDGMSGELWVKSNKRDSSRQMFFNRSVYWDTNNKLGASVQSGHYYGDDGAAINSIQFTGAGSVSMVMFATLWGGLD